LFFSKIPYDKYREYSKLFLYIIIVVLVLTFLFAPRVKGAQRWINLGFIQFQPSEAAKVLLLIHLSVMLERMGDGLKDFKKGLKFPLIWVVIVSALVLIQPNVSTSLIIVMTSFVLIYIAGARKTHILGIVAPAIFLVGSSQ